MCYLYVRRIIKETPHCFLTSNSNIPFITSVTDATEGNKIMSYNNINQIKPLTNSQVIRNLSAQVQQQNTQLSNLMQNYNSIVYRLKVLENDIMERTGMSYEQLMNWEQDKVQKLIDQTRIQQERERNNAIFHYADESASGVHIERPQYFNASQYADGIDQYQAVSNCHIPNCQCSKCTGV